MGEDESADGHGWGGERRNPSFSSLRWCTGLIKILYSRYLHLATSVKKLNESNSIIPESPTNRPIKGPGWLLPTGFIVLVCALLALSSSFDIPLASYTPVNRDLLEPGARRVAMSDPPHLMVNGRSQTCNGCHQIFASASAPRAPRTYHESVHLSHGLNDRCVNCHDPKDRERLTLRDGSTIPFSQTPQLCAQCHGTLYRDWQRGTHGKTLGSWVTHSDAQRRLNCNECHDPHSPRYEPYAPLPAPNTLRMGEQGDSTNHESGSQVSPLRRWLHQPHTGEHQ